MATNDQRAKLLRQVIVHLTALKLAAVSLGPGYAAEVADLESQIQAKQAVLASL